MKGRLLESASNLLLHRRPHNDATRHSNLRAANLVPNLAQMSSSTANQGRCKPGREYIGYILSILGLEGDSHSHLQCGHSTK
jgi:hypothetical protein